MKTDKAKFRINCINSYEAQSACSPLELMFHRSANLDDHQRENDKKNNTRYTGISTQPIYSQTCLSVNFSSDMKALQKLGLLQIRTK